MLNTKKLLYILPDSTYIAELLPGKKEHEFTIQAFRQINGEFIDDNLLIPENIEKLVNKIEEEEYHLILPDFLFTNTIVEVKDGTKAKTHEFLQQKLLPELGLNPDTHQVETFVLTEHQKKSKVQISALEKNILEPFRRASKDKNIQIVGVSNLSWTIKAIISLEPSISVIQIGSMLYLALHYIGLDQTISFNIDDIANIVETIKTLKGGEPSIQTLYLLSNPLVEEKLKELLSGPLPIQQLAVFSEDKELPSYVKQTIETGMKTLSIEDFHVPVFKIGKAGDTAMPEGMEADQEDGDPKEAKPIKLEKAKEKTADRDEKSVKALAEDFLPVPVLPQVELKVDDQDLELAAEIEAKKEARAAQPEATKAVVEEKPDLDHQDQTMAKEDFKPVAMPTSMSNDHHHEDSKNDQNSAPDLHQFAPSSETGTIVKESSGQSRPVIKNHNQNSTMLKMVFITLAVLFITVGVGVGLGIGFLTISNNSKQTDTSPIVEVSKAPEAMPSPSPSPSPSASPIDKAKTKILVVNATTTAGKAGKIKTQLSAAGFTDVDAGNAKGEYETGTMVLMKEKQDNLITELETALDVKVIFSDKIAVEDTKAAYDVVIVLAQ